MLRISLFFVQPPQVRELLQVLPVLRSHRLRLQARRKKLSKRHSLQQKAKKAPKSLQAVRMHQSLKP